MDPSEPPCSTRKTASPWSRPVRTRDRVDARLAVAAVVRVRLKDQELSGRVLGRVVRTRRGQRLALHAPAQDRRIARDRTEVRSRQPLQEIARRRGQRDRERVPRRHQAGDVFFPPRSEVGLADDVVDQPRTWRLRAERGRERALEGIPERLGRDGLARGRREAEPLSDAERVGATVRRDVRHRLGGLRLQTPPLRCFGHGLVQQLEARGALHLEHAGVGRQRRVVDGVELLGERQTKDIPGEGCDPVHDPSPRPTVNATSPAPAAIPCTGWPTASEPGRAARHIDPADRCRVVVRDPEAVPVERDRLGAFTRRELADLVPTRAHLEHRVSGLARRPSEPPTARHELGARGHARGVHDLIGRRIDLDQPFLARNEERPVAERHRGDGAEVPRWLPEVRIIERVVAALSRDPFLDVAGARIHAQDLASHAGPDGSRSDRGPVEAAITLRRVVVVGGLPAGADVHPPQDRIRGVGHPE